jgi:uncharacterized protein YbjT (DUF2867 family)
MTNNSAKPIAVLGGTGKVGRRVVEGLRARHFEVRVGARSAVPRFDWNEATTWSPYLDGARAVFIAYAPDIAVPGAADTVEAVTRQAAAHGVEHIVLLSGRGEDEAMIAEQRVQAIGVPCTVLRASWFAQNFSEHFFLEPVLAGHVALPADTVTEPFVDVDDIAEVACAVLTSDGHAGRTYELTGPHAITFREAVAEISRATGMPIEFTTIPLDAFSVGLAEAGLTPDEVGLVAYLFSTVLDGRNSLPADGVQQVLGRKPRDFTAYAAQTAATGAWNPR